MRVLIVGAYGLIGSAILARLHADGHDVVGAGRSLELARRRFPFARWIVADFDRLTTTDAWRPLVAGVDAVVNCVGVLQDGGRDDTMRVHVTATIALFEACREAKLGVVHLSAIGADIAGPTAFACTKGAADEHLKTLDFDWLILRPGLVLAPGAYGGTAMLRAIAGVPLVTPLIGAGRLVQVVSVDDVAATVARCLSPTAPSRAVWDLVHPQVLTLGDVVVSLRRWLGFGQQPILNLPHPVETLVAKVADGLGYLGWRSPARSTAFVQLAAGIVGDPSGWIAATGIRPASLEQILAGRPSTVQDRWFARLYALKPAAIAALMLFWIVTGLVSLGPGHAAAMGYLQQARLPAPEAILVAGSIFDIVLGLLLLVRRFTRAVLLIMLAVTPIYLLVGTAFAPQLWLDPLGPFLKIVPMLLATLFTLAILDER